MTPPLRLRLIGAAALLLPDGAELALDRQGALIAARLALAGSQPRATLAALLWPGAGDARSRANLRQRLLRLKTLAGRSWVVGDQLLCLAPDVQVLPIEGVGEVVPWPELSAELLQGIEAVESGDLADWLAHARASRRAAQLRRLATEANAAEKQQRLNDAINMVRRMLVIEPQAELHHRELMRLHYLNDDRAGARAAYEHLRGLLAREFDAVPGEQTQDLLRLLMLTPAPAAPSVQVRTQPTAVALQRPPTLVGRETELATLRQALGQGGAIMLIGEAGIGKSRLLSEAMQGRADVLKVKAQAGDAGVPFAALARLLRQLLQHWPAALHAMQGGGEHAGDGRGLATLARLLPELAGVQPAANATESTPTDRMALFEAVAFLLDAAQAAAVAVDDLHFADDASLDMLTALVACERLSRLTWFFAQRPGEDSAASARLRDTLTLAQRLQTVSLPALDAEQMAGLLLSLQVSGLDAAAWAQRLVRHTGGNPLFALETLKQLGSQAGSAALLPQPPSVLALIERRLRRLSEAALGLARVAAIAGPEFCAGLAASVLQRPAVALSDAWAELEAAQVLRDEAFAHDLIFEATRRTIPAPLARHLHGCVATWMESNSSEPARLAAHWQAAGLPARAVPWLERAADRAHAQLRPIEEAGFLQQLVAAVEVEDPARAVRVLLRLAPVRVEAQGFEAAAAPLERALQLASDGPLRLQALNLLSEIQLNRLMPDASAQSAEQAFALARELGAEAAAAEAVLRWHRALCMAGRAAQGEAVWQAQQGWMATVSWRNAECVSDRGWVLDRLGRPREARAWHQRALAMAQAGHRPIDEAVVLGNLAQSLLLSGEPGAAASVLDRAEALSARHQGLHGASDYMAVHRGMAAAALGRFADALQHFDKALADTAHQSSAARHAVLAHRAMLWASIGQRSRALADAAPVMQQPALPPWMKARAHLAIALTSTQPHDLAAGLERAIQALGDPAQVALDAPVRLRLNLLAADGSSNKATAQAAALRATRAMLRQARRDGHKGLRWAAHWTAAQLAVACGQHLVARRHARACNARPAGELAPLVTDGAWWHGLWQVWRALGDPPRALAARAAGLGWIEQTLHQQLPPEFHTSFRDAVDAHRTLISGMPFPLKSALHS